MNLRIAIIDADLVSRTRHRFPNLASMKISGYHKSLGDIVTLVTDYNPDKFLNHNIVNYKAKYDRIYISKVFVDSNTPFKLLNMDMTMYGGSGFFGSDSEGLPKVIEHFMPDYHLYDNWIAEQKALGSPDKEFRYYELYSMGYTTRGCVRQCSFCINKHCTKVEKASSIKEFFNVDMRNLCLLDDNILAYEGWKEVFEELNTLNKMYEFKQGLDIRMLTEEKALVLVKSNLNIPGIYFAFDNIKEKLIIEEKLTLWRKHYHKHTSMYVLCGYDENGNYDEEFWSRDIESTLERIKICMKYNVFPYIMRYKNFKSAPSPYYGMYVNLASWCNQKGTIVKYSFTEWANRMQLSDEKLHNKTHLYSIKRYYFEYAGKHPDIAYEYFDMCYDDISEYKYIRDTGSDGKEKPLNKPKTFEVKVIKKIEKVEVVIKDIKIIPHIIETVPKLLNEKFVHFDSNNIKLIYQSNIDLLILNCKQEILGNHEKAILNFSKVCMSDNANLIINNINLKSFNLTREYIEKNTNLIFKEVAIFTVKHNGDYKALKYCTRYSLNTDVNMFKADKTYSRIDLMKIIIPKTTNQKDTIVSFFDRYDILKTLGQDYYTRNWIYFGKQNIKTSQYAVNAINKIIKSENKEDNEQTSLIGDITNVNKLG